MVQSVLRLLKTLLLFGLCVGLAAAAYLFRDRQSGELQVIYRRNHGGYGVIQARE